MPESSSQDEDDEVEYLGSGSDSPFNNALFDKCTDSDSIPQETVDLVSDTDREVKIVSVTSKKSPEKQEADIKSLVTVDGYKSALFDSFDDDEHMRHSSDDIESLVAVAENKKPIVHSFYDEEVMKNMSDDNEVDNDDVDEDDFEYADSIGEFEVLEEVTTESEDEPEAQEDAEDSDEEQDVADAASFSSVEPSSRSASPESEADEDSLDGSFDDVGPTIGEVTPTSIPEQKMKIDNIIAPQNAPATIVKPLDYAFSDEYRHLTPGQSPGERTIGLPPVSSFFSGSSFDMPNKEPWMSVHTHGYSFRPDEDMTFGEAPDMTSGTSHNRYTEAKIIDQLDAISKEANKEALAALSLASIYSNSKDVATSVEATKTLPLHADEVSFQRGPLPALMYHLSTMTNLVPEESIAVPELSQQIHIFQEKIKAARSSASRQRRSFFNSELTEPSNDVMNTGAKDIAIPPLNVSPDDSANPVTTSQAEGTIEKADLTVITTPYEVSAESSEAASIPAASISRPPDELCDLAQSTKNTEDKKRRRTEDEEASITRNDASAPKATVVAPDSKTLEPSPKRARLALPAFKLPVTNFPVCGLSLAQLRAYKPISFRRPGGQMIRTAASSAIVPVLPIMNESASTTLTWGASVKPFLYGTLVGSVGIFGALLSMPELK
jgi:hypothetical protein